MGHDHTINHITQRRLEIALFLVFLFTTCAYAQKISVSRFYLAESDLTAQNRSTMLEDQNGDKCALIRVQTTQKGFTFDVGSAGIQKIDDNHAGEIWVYVPFGIRHISIRHPQLGSLSNYNFPINIEKARTYIMEITSDKVFVNNYDDTRKQKLKIKVTIADAEFTLNGMKVPLNYNGETTLELSFGTYTYKVESTNFHSKEGQITINDSTKDQQLTINNLEPIMGVISIHTIPNNAKISIDGKTVPDNTSIVPFQLQVGSHKLVAKKDGYKTEEKDIEIKQDDTTEVEINLSKTTLFQFTSIPTGADLTINGQKNFSTNCSVELETGKYEIKATKRGYKSYHKTLFLNSSNPNVKIPMKKVHNYKNEFYAEGSIRAGAFFAFGGNFGGYISNFNIEMAAYYGTGHEYIYWNDGDLKPTQSFYSPELTISGKLGYGIPIDTRFRITPQVGFNHLRLKESTNDTSISPAKGANVTSAVLGIRFSGVIASHFGLSLSPEYTIASIKSKGYKVLSNVSSKIKKWGEGFNIKISIMMKF